MSIQEKNKELFSEYLQNKSIKTRNKIVEDNLSLVKSLAKKHNSRSKYSQQSYDNYLDLYQVGVIGLIKAIEKFDSKKNIHFSTYAYSKISSEIRHYIRDKGDLIRLPSTLQEINQKITKHSFKNNISYEKATLELGIDFNKAQESKNIFSQDFLPLDEEIINNFIDTSNPKEIFIKDLLAELSETQKYIVICKYCHNISLKHISEILNIRPQVVKKLEIMAISYLRTKVKKDFIENYG